MLLLLDCYQPVKLEIKHAPLLHCPDIFLFDNLIGKFLLFCIFQSLPDFQSSANNSETLAFYRSKQPVTD